MKRMKQVIAGALAAGVLCCGALAAGGGSAEDPLISLSYLTETFLPKLLGQTEARVDSTLQKTYDQAVSDLNAAVGQPGQGGDGSADRMTEVRLKSGDLIALPTGSTLLTLDGKVTLTSGRAVDATAGHEVNGAAGVENGHQYISAEDSQAVYVVTSDTAVVWLEGRYAVTGSSSPDYFMLADALKAMGLFQGGDQAVAGGYDLEGGVNRLQGVVMFIRMLGEEEAALASTAENPFRDVPAWGERYIAYAFEKGYAKGGDQPGIFGADDPMDAGQYMVLLLRALGYRDSGENPDYQWSESLSFAREQGLISEGEHNLLSGTAFHRAQLVYLSYYSLTFPVKGGTDTLLDRLLAAGVVDLETAQRAQASVTCPRVS